MINIIKKEIDVEESLRKRLEIICDFCNTTPTIINGSIRKVDKTNLSYIEPHKIIINNNVFLAFNYSNDIYIPSTGIFNWTLHHVLLIFIFILHGEVFYDIWNNQMTFGI